MSMKNSNDTIGSRTRDLPACRAVPTYRERVAVRVQNKESRTTNKVWYPILRIRRGRTPPHPKKPACYRILRMDSGLDECHGTPCAAERGHSTGNSVLQLFPNLFFISNLIHCFFCLCTISAIFFPLYFSGLTGPSSGGLNCTCSLWYSPPLQMSLSCGRWERTAVCTRYCT